MDAVGADDQIAGVDGPIRRVDADARLGRLDLDDALVQADLVLRPELVSERLDHGLAGSNLVCECWFSRFLHQIQIWCTNPVFQGSYSRSNLVCKSRFSRVPRQIQIWCANPVFDV